MSKVYVIVEADAEEACKVGVAANPYARLRELQTANPRRLVLAYTSRELDKPTAHRVERTAHRALSDHRIRLEWFGCLPETAIVAVQDAGGFWR